MERIHFTKLHPAAKTPLYASADAAGADLFACISTEVQIPAGATVMIHTGIAVAIPSGFAGFIYARSGLASKRGLAPANKVGVIDSDYRGEILVALHNHSGETQTISDGERIAQLVIAPVLRATFEECETLDETIRGDGGFGSTGRS